MTIITMVLRAIMAIRAIITMVLRAIMAIRAIITVVLRAIMATQVILQSASMEKRKMLVALKQTIMTIATQAEIRAKNMVTTKERGAETTMINSKI
jgi:hypothetical protein